MAAAQAQASGLASWDGVVAPASARPINAFRLLCAWPQAYSRRRPRPCIPVPYEQVPRYAPACAAPWQNSPPVPLDHSSQSGPNFPLLALASDDRHVLRIGAYGDSVLDVHDGQCLDVLQQ